MIQNIPFAEYQAIKAINASAIKKGRISMKAMKHYLENGQKATTTMDFGDCIHAFILEPDRFSYVVWTGKVKNGKKWDAFKKESGDKFILTPDQEADLKNIAEAVMADPDAKHIIRDCQKEVALTWDNEVVGAAKCRVDCLSPSYAADLKTTEAVDIGVRWYKNSSYKMGNHIQAAFNLEGAGKNAKNAPDTFYNVVIQQHAPYDVVVYEMTKDLIERGRREVLDILQRWKVACLTESFTGVCPNGITLLDVPEYVKKQIGETQEVPEQEMEATEL